MPTTALHAGGAALACVLPKLTALEKLSIARANLRSAGVGSIADAFVSALRKRNADTAGHKVHPLRELDLSHNSAGSSGAHALALALQGMTLLVKLVYAGNQPGRQGLGDLVSALVRCPELQVRPRLPVCLSTVNHIKNAFTRSTQHLKQ